MMKQYTFHPAPNCHPDRQYAPYNPAAFIPAYPSYNANNSNNKRHSVQNYTGIYNGFANDRTGGSKPTRPTSYMPPASNGQYYQAYRVNARRPSITTIPPAPTRPPPPPPPRQSSPPAQNNGPAKSKHLRRLSPLVIPASASPPPIFLKPEPPRMPPPQQQQQYRPYQVQPPSTHTLPQQHSKPPPLLRPSPQRPPPRPASAEIESFLYQNPCMLPPMLPSPTTPLSTADTRPRYSLPALPSNAAPQLRRSKASRRASHVVTPRRVSAGPWPLSAEPIIDDEAISLVRKFSFEETRSSATEERKALLVDVGAPPLRGGSEGSTTSGEWGSEQEAVTPVDEVGETPAEYRMQQADALRELLGLVLEDEGEVEGVVGEFGFGGDEGGKGEGVVSVVGAGDEEVREMVARGLGRFSAEAYLAEIDEMKGVFV